MNGLSIGLDDTGINSSIAVRSYLILLSPISGLISWIDEIAEPLMNAVLLGSYSCFFKSSLNSSSIKSTISVSLIISILFKKTIIWLTPICLHKRTCYLVCGIGPSVAATTKIPASILAAPVIMFLT